jgi:hypothetical protein
VAQASFQWQRLVHQLQDSPLTELDFKVVKQLPLSQVMRPRKWLFGLAGGAVLLLWDGKLVLATGAGAAMMLTVYLVQEGRWKLPRFNPEKFLQGVNHHLALAVGAGATVTLGTYMAASIWADSGSPWIALGETMQGFGILTILGLLGWQALKRPSQQDEAYFNQLLADLTHDDPLKRLIAVRQITHLVAQNRLEPGHDRTIADYFRLLLSREKELTIRDAVLEGLYELDTVRQLMPSSEPTFSPPMRRSPVKVRRRVSNRSQD